MILLYFPKGPYVLGSLFAGKRFTTYCQNSSTDFMRGCFLKKKRRGVAFMRINISNLNLYISKFWPRIKYEGGLGFCRCLFTLSTASKTMTITRKKYKECSKDKTYITNNVAIWKNLKKEVILAYFWYLYNEKGICHAWLRLVFVIYNFAKYSLWNVMSAKTSLLWI